MVPTNGYILTLGETLALFSGAQIGSFTHLSQANVGIGGAESNVAAGLSRLGVPVSWAGRIGDDSLGRKVVREIRGEGVEVFATIDTDAPTGLMLKEYRGRGTSRVAYYRAQSAGSRLSTADITPGVVENAALVHLTGITPLLSESARETCFDVVRRAKASGVRISFDINYRSSLAATGDASGIIGELAADADLIFGSPEEIELVANRSILKRDSDSHSVVGSRVGEWDIQEIVGLAHTYDPAGQREMVVKRGASGATTVIGETVASAPGHIIEVVDTVGAGDAFVAGYLSGDVQGWTIEQKLVRANACGALMCTIPGDWEASPTPHELVDFLSYGADPVQR